MPFSLLSIEFIEYRASLLQTYFSVTFPENYFWTNRLMGLFQMLVESSDRENELREVKEKVGQWLSDQSMTFSVTLPQAKISVFREVIEKMKKITPEHLEQCSDEEILENLSNNLLLTPNSPDSARSGVPEASAVDTPGTRSVRPTPVRAVTASDFCLESPLPLSPQKPSAGVGKSAKSAEEMQVELERRLSKLDFKSVSIATAGIFSERAAKRTKQGDQVFGKS